MAIRSADASLEATGVSKASVLVGDVHSLGLKYCSIHIVHFEDFLHHTADRQGPWRIREERVEKRASSK
ncbi:MAG: hypothetical protein GTO63_17380 [Anaerolineae bacterium]|nr:hypothetical protein [Anaerolineae bacterium]NIN96566.1 hypothetical protein [Anaerolineae bacterium]NIQ79595.1 hypothetical protein [Anaerolineae bacterium]